MDRQLAQRMVGAACLLAVLVLVVPAILDGNRESGGTITDPASDESLDLRTHTIRLDGDEREPPVPTTVQAGAVIEPELPAPSPGPASAQPGSEANAVEREAVRSLAQEPVAEAAKAAPANAAVPKVEAQPEPRPEPRPEPAPGPKSVTAKAPSSVPSGTWMVQLGSFSQRANADRLAADLERKGFSASVQAGGGTSGNLFRVRAGPVADRVAAEDLAKRLAAAGFKGGRIGQQ